MDVLTQTLYNALRILDALHDASVPMPHCTVGLMGYVASGLLQPQGHRVGRSEIEIDAAHRPCTQEVRRNTGVVGHIGHTPPHEARRNTGVVGHIGHTLPDEARRITRRIAGVLSHIGHTLP